MKLVITLTMVAMCFQITMAQATLSDDLGYQEALQNDRTPELEQLYERAKQLENTGTAAAIEANRLAIKDAWLQVNPKIAALYKPVDNNGLLPETEANMAVNGIQYYPQLKERDERPLQTRDWDVDRLLLDDFVDGGVDIEVTGTGDIYISAFQNDIENEGAMFDEIFIYRSLDGGVTFEEWQRVNVTAPMRKMQLISLDGTGDQYLAAYLVTDTENFQVWRWNTANGDFVAQGIATDVTDFGVDRNFPAATSGMRVSATYVKSGTIHSARSTAGSYGFDWVDELNFGTNTSQLDFTYGRAGAYYTTYIGGVSGNLYTRANTNFNDPVSWEVRETLEAGASVESVDPTIIATRKVLASDEVLVLTSSRAVGSTLGYNHNSYIRENGGAFATLFTGIALPNQSVAHIDAWIRKGTDFEEIVTSYIVDIIDESSNNIGRYYGYDGTNLTPNEMVSDADIDVWNGFSAAVAETNDNMPCMAFTGTSGGGSFGYGLYFDAKTEIILNTQDLNIEGLTYFPNPTRDVLHVQANTTLDSVEVYSITGAKVIDFKNNELINTISVNTSNLASGIYVMKVTAGSQTGTYKVVKQ